MDLEDNITFYQSDLSTVSFAAFEDMRKTGEFCDLTIKVQNHSFTAHRMIVAAAIPYFRSVLTLDSGVETQEKEIAVGDLDPKALELMIHFAYCSKVNISVENVQSLLVASQFLQLNQVHDACVEFLSQRLSIDSIIQVRTLALSLNNSSLIESYKHYIRRNFEEFSKLDDFLSLPYSHIKEIISDDDLSVPGEETVFDAVILWVKNSLSERQAILPELLSEVRMTYIPTDSLKKIACEELVRTCGPCRDLLEEVKNYHLWPEEKSMFPNLKTVPRKHFLTEEIRFYAVSWCDANKRVSIFYRDFIKWHDLTSKEETDSICHVAAVDEEVYMFSPEKMEIFHVKTLEWEERSYQYSELRGMSCSAVVSHGNRIYFFGSHDNKYVYQVCHYDTQLRKWTKQQTLMNMARCNSAAASLGNSIYLTGGCTGAGALDSPFNTAEKYDPSAIQWSKIASMLNARHSHGSTIMNEKLYVCGGIGIGEFLIRTAEVYDPLTDQWSSVSSMTDARQSFTLISHNMQMYVLGGKQLTEDKANTVVIYDSECDQWKTGFGVPEGIIGAVLMPTTRN